MIDWAQVIENSIWLGGLAVMLAAFSLASYTADGSFPHPGARLTTTWAKLSKSAWLLVGGVLFCLGMGLTAGSWLETSLWMVLGLTSIVAWTTIPRTTNDRRPTTDEVESAEREMGRRTHSVLGTLYL